jgi:ATP-binding cassette subfamily B protein
MNGKLVRHYNTISNLFFCIKYSLNHKREYLIFVVLHGLCWGLTPLVLAFLPKVIIDMLQNGAEVRDIVIIMIGLTIAVIIVGLLQDWAKEKKRALFVNLKMCLNEDRVKKVHCLNYEDLEDPAILNLMDRARYATEGDYDGFGAVYNNIACFVKNILTIIVTVSTVAVINPIIIVFIGISCYSQYRILEYTKRINKEKFTDIMPSRWRKITYLNNITNDFEFAKDIRLYKMRDIINLKNREVNLDAHNITKEMFNRWIKCSLIMNICVLIQNGILYGWLIYNVICRGMTIGNFSLYLGILMAFSNNVVQCFDVIADTKRASLEIDDYRSFVELEEQTKSGVDIIDNINFDKYEFVFENVSFKYPRQEKWVLKNINLTIDANKKLAVVGNNGAGKTTFIKLLMRLYEPTGGRILLNGIDIRKFEIKSYYKIFAPVFQDMECFAMSIKQNVSMKGLEYTNDTKVFDTLNRSGLTKKINRLDNGIQTELLKIFNNKAVDLSGGEKQKLALARALYKDANVLIFDEPTAALDAIAEDTMYRQFDKMIENKTAIYISHRLSSTRFCDQIVMFANGTIAEMGTHSELLANNKLYNEMYNMQSIYYQDTYE